MTTSQTGRTAPWAKALGAVLLALLGAIIVANSIANSRETDRKHSAFEATRTDAQRFADSVVARHNAPPTSRQAIQAALDTSTGNKNGLLYSMQPAERRTKVVIQLTRSYPRSLALFGPAEATVDRCFTVIFEIDEVRHLSADITAHTADERCSGVVHQNS
ncbi:hypothetical protein ACFZCU_47625 [Streptomyces canus]|jgi:type II secretory pathway pseudopilin PulG|uniref:hypothetical protein n=1 Tax=Streptomyces canus TaxID=58343 RepID=UPI0036F0501A